MKKLEPRIHDESNGLDYVLVGDYYIPAITLPDEAKNSRHVGKWGVMHREYLRQEKPWLLNELTLNCKLNTYLSDLNEQAQDRYERIVRQLMESEGVNEELKRWSQMDWIRAMGSITNRAEEIIRHEMIYV